MSNAFTYTGTQAPAPQVQAVLPASGPVHGGTAISIIGQGFLSGAGAGIGGRALAGLEIRSTTLITGVAPEGSAGAFDVTVTNRDGQSSSKTHGFIYVDSAALAPRIDSIAPTAGPDAGGTEVIVTGEFFQPGARVYVDRYPLTSLEFVSAQALRGRTTAGNAGTFPVRIWNPDGKTNQLGVTFEYLAGPEAITLVDPFCAGGQFGFLFQSQSGRNYTVEFNDDLRHDQLGGSSHDGW